jgi:hypothetical protein
MLSILLGDSGHLHHDPVSARVAQQRPAQLLQRLGHVGKGRPSAKRPGLALQQRNVPMESALPHVWRVPSSAACRMSWAIVKVRLFVDWAVEVFAKFDDRGAASVS